MTISKISARGQTVLPKKVREHLQLGQGSVVSYEFEGEKVTLRKVPAFDESYYRGIDAMLGEEWNSPEDEEAFRDL